MAKIENRLDKKVTAYIDNLFSGVGPSQQLFDLEEELAINIKEKTADFKARGMDDEQAFKEAVISMGDLSGLVDDMRKLGQDTAKQSVYSTMTARISTAGIVAGVLLGLFGIFTVAMLYFMDLDAISVTGSGIFIVAGGTLLTQLSHLKNKLKLLICKRFGIINIKQLLFSEANFSERQVIARKTYPKNVEFVLQKEEIPC
ncbi:permease prefix domain 1-containing protein [Desulfoscipio gibsoniae]|uniref:permease prefix domain 1-containing protein n=1 Tax=Desulfoscipio gibsoniae TaxID=102134 RepID=UPI000232C67F|nr:permease prefix domain 1-containing protein [Desulfoscipio gibsoniae]